LFWSG
jgi:hypothetical protein